MNPGFPGQKFLPQTAARLERTRAMVEASGRAIALCVDGGITAQNIESVAALGPELIVTGSAVFDGVAPADNARSMLAAVRGTTAR